MKKWSLFALIFTVFLVLAACGTEEAAKEEENTNSGDDKKVEESSKIKIKHELDDEEVVLEKTPEKVVVFDFGILDTLDELGIEVAGVPQASIPPYLDKYSGSQYTNAGSLKEPDFEAIHAMKPDVIFISGRQADLYDEFKEIAPTIYVGLDYSNYMDSFTHNMEMIAEVFGKEEQIKAELEEVNQTIASIKEQTSGKDEKALIILGTEGKISAYGPSSRFGIIHDVFGFKAADENIEVSTHGQSVTFEYISETNPEILFVIDRDAAINANSSVKDSLENELVQKTNAYKNGKIIYLNAGPWYLSGGGLQSMKQMAEDVKAGL
ncbi:siderophore ABC transporter substrate-binding protein [Bacillus sp. S/N-304-OC-R1]|uniref:siderophore ABC transporter substrate-binding protein n=1 Tax=Bacillus sp. S/N-304-OC-R1 TaxID=2758034 RepID=UPI001C8E8269|nr:siderophore ABC transporter substrate-binding protein [Bacillus sp. S/N-304-OC-R1]MBY0121299.1 siderophore ABC transporter substrate-binding protein [Bacillus sp. S/N-304-OC-R1]